jgi:very-short-patch-repair endonuclease
LRLVVDAGLPAPQTQVQVCGFRVVRDQGLTAAGLTCLRFTNAQVRREQAAVARTLRSVADQLRSRVGHFPT